MMTNYEGRIREFSSPEKVFSVFASVSKDGHNCIINTIISRIIMYILSKLFFTIYIPFSFIAFFNAYALNLQDMTVDDFIKAVIPVEHDKAVTEKKAGKKRKTLPGAFKLADQNGDGLISFEEYLTGF